MTRCSIYALVLAGLVACDKSSKSPPAVASADGEAGLRALFAQARAACASKDYATGKAIVLGTLPTRESVAKAFRDGADSTVLDRTMELYTDVPADEAKVACLFSPEGRTQIAVHRATTEEIHAYAEGSVAYAEFPGGARKLAAQVLRPGVAFYEVETLEPGKDSGTKFHMFFWDGARWRMLGPAWRALPGSR